MMTGRRRELMHRVMDGHPGLLPVMHHLDSYVLCDKMLEWLVANRIIGSHLLDVLHQYYNGSILSLAKFIKAQVTREEEKPILVGKDYISRIS